MLTVSPTNGGTVRGFADVNGFGSGGGTPATISLSSDATVLFDMDELELTLTLTASSAGGTVSSTVRFVSSARGFKGSGLATGVFVECGAGRGSVWVVGSGIDDMA